jgi:hypothetical protein
MPGPSVWFGPLACGGVEYGNRGGHRADQGGGRSARLDRRPAGPGTLSRRGARPLPGCHPARRPPGFDRGGGRGGTDLRRSEIADRAARRQHRPRWRRGPARGRAQHRSGARPHESYPRDRPGQFYDDGRGRAHPRRSAAGRRRGRPAVPVEPWCRGELPDRRQPVDQRRRHRGIALWQYPRIDPGPRGRIARRADLGWAAGAAQGQYRL